MSSYKTAEINFKISASSSDIITNATFFSQDYGLGKFKFKLTNNTLPLDLTGATAILTIVTADKSTFQYTCDIGEDPTQGIAEIVLDKDVLQHIGTATAELTIVFSDSQSLSAGQFKFVIAQSLSDQSSGAIQYYIQSIENLKVQYQQEWESWFNTIKGQLGSDPAGNLQNQINDVTAQLAKSVVEGYGLTETRKRLLRGEEIRVVLVGDSIAYGSAAGDNSLDWESTVKLKLINRFPQATISWTNSAVGGTTSTYLKDNWETLVTPFNPNVIIISHGTNDIHMPDQERLDNYAFFKQKAEELGAEVLLVTNSTVMFTPTPYGNNSDTETDRREEIAEMTRNIAREYKWGLADANNAWRKWISDHGLDLTTTLLHYDHIHPNDLGHKLIAYEVLNAFYDLPIDMFFLDEHFGGKGYDLFGKRTFRDVEHELSNVQGWGIFDLNHQLVDWGGLWWIRDYIGRSFKKAKLYGTQAVTGNEEYMNNYQPNWHIIPKDNDYIELEVNDAKRVWLAIDGNDTTPTKFSIKVDGVEVQQLDVSSDSKQPVEVPFNTNGLKFFRKGVHKVRLERIGTIPSNSYVEFHGFLVKFYDKNEPEIFDTPVSESQVVQPSVVYQTLDYTITTRQKASNIGIVAPFGYTEFDNGFVQLKTKQPAVFYAYFYGDVCKVRLKNLTTDNYVAIYIDDVLKEIVNLKDTTTGTVNVRQFTGLGFGTKHLLEVIAVNAEINLQGIRFSDTIA